MDATAGFLSLVYLEYLTSSDNLMPGFLLSIPGLFGTPCNMHERINFRKVSTILGDGQGTS